MVYSKIKRILLILLCVFVLFFPFWCVAGLCAEEVEPSIVNGIIITPNSNHFSSSTNGSVGYIALEPGYIYDIYYNSSTSSAIRLAVSSSIPSLNGQYSYLGEIIGRETYSYACYDTSDFLYFDYSWGNVNVIITRTKISNMDGAVVDLVDNVGPNAIWSVFDTGINYIYVVVLVAFGIFILSLIIRKITKGKEGF